MSLTCWVWLRGDRLGLLPVRRCWVAEPTTSWEAMTRTVTEMSVSALGTMMVTVPRILLHHLLRSRHRGALAAMIFLGVSSRIVITDSRIQIEVDRRQRFVVERCSRVAPQSMMGANGTSRTGVAFCWRMLCEWSTRVGNQAESSSGTSMCGAGRGSSRPFLGEGPGSRSRSKHTKYGLRHSFPIGTCGSRTHPGSGSFPGCKGKEGRCNGAVPSPSPDGHHRCSNHCHWEWG